MRIKRFNESNVHDMDIIPATEENIISLKGIYLVIEKGKINDCIQIEEEGLVTAMMGTDEIYEAEDYLRIIGGDYLIDAKDIEKLLSEPLKIKTESDKFKI